MVFFKGYVKDIPQKSICGRCEEGIQQSELAVFAPKLKEHVSNSLPVIKLLRGALYTTGTRVY